MDNIKKQPRKISILRQNTFSTNPFFNELSTKNDVYDFAKSRVRKVANGKGEYLVHNKTGEIPTVAGFWQAQQVDPEKFVKLYINGVRAFSDLTKAGTKVFELVYLEMQKNIGKDNIYLNFHSIDQDLNPFSKSSFFNGLTELVSKKFIAPSNLANIFWINPDFAFNGDRLSFVQTYFKTEDFKEGIQKKSKDNLTIDFIEQQKEGE